MAPKDGGRQCGLIKGGDGGQTGGVKEVSRWEVGLLSSAQLSRGIRASSVPLHISPAPCFQSFTTNRHIARPIALDAHPTERAGAETSRCISHTRVEVMLDGVLLMTSPSRGGL